jgi:hypothetical protein
LGTDLSKLVLREEIWLTYVATYAFCYNSSVHATTGEGPCGVIFGVDAFKLDANVNNSVREDDKPEYFPSQLAEWHQQHFLIERWKRNRKRDVLKTVQ